MVCLNGDRYLYCTAAAQYNNNYYEIMNDVN